MILLSHSALGEGPTPYIGSAYVQPQSVEFYEDILVRNKVSSLVIMVPNSVWFLYPSLELGMPVEEATSFIIIDKTSN